MTRRDERDMNTNYLLVPLPSHLSNAICIKLALSVYPLTLAKSKADSPNVFLLVGSVLASANKALTHSADFASSTPSRMKTHPIRGVLSPSERAFGSAPCFSKIGII